MESYVDVLLKSLENKIEILKKIKEKNKKQAEILKTKPFAAEEFDRNTSEKGNLISELSKLDDGFDVVYSRVREELANNKDKYRNEILKMQALISEITDRSVSIQAEERRNKTLVESVFADERKASKQSKKTSKVSLDYYKNMSRTNYVDPQFMDTHK
jgi:hypothetical protein